MYKCSAKAQLVYMYLMGRENSDGKATGVVHKFQPDGSYKLAGSFKIMADGIITRFTGMSSADWRNFMGSAQKEYDAKYSEKPADAPASTESKIA